MTVMNPAALNTGLQVSASLLSVILDIYVGMEFLGLLVILRVNSKENSPLFPLVGGSGLRILRKMSEGEQQIQTGREGPGEAVSLLVSCIPTPNSLYLERKRSNLGGEEKRVRNFFKKSP